MHVTSTYLLPVHPKCLFKKPPKRGDKVKSAIMAAGLKEREIER